ncbi:hypothetical protein F5Y06DRAFT_45087 [Hypoxylon sp. FL0890]|nr:hypothetical protein F5Y06DRAFT_45087 [Hypoxylon sp. FL0890]
MATNKRRKLNVSEPPQAMSAFALRKKLLSQQTTTSTATATTTDTVVEVDTVSPSPGPGETDKSRGSKKPKKRPAVQPTSSPENEASFNLKHSPPAEADIAPESPVALAESPSPPTSDDEVSVKPAKALPIQLSNFKPSKSNYQRQKDGRIVLKLSEGDRLVILGSYGLRVTSGEITINGATLRSSDKVHWVDAPYCHALPVIRCSDSATTELLPHPHTAGLRSLGKPSPLFRKLWNESSVASDAKSPPPDSTFQILYTATDGPKKTVLQDLVSPPEWNREIARLMNASNSKPSSFMITGPKSSGKSTFGKILANRLITGQLNGSKDLAHRGVAVLDFDPGQPEYCVAGQIALVLMTEPVLSPSFSRPLSSQEIQIVRSHALASISPASDPELFLEAALDLMTHYRNTLARYPLVINTPGWIQGTGLDLLTSLITSLRPTQVVYMSESGPAEAVEALQESCKATGFSTLPSQASQLTSRTAAHFRLMQTMSYFHAEPRSGETDRYRIQWNSKPLTTVPPWQVSYIGPNRGVFGIMFYDYQAPLDLLAEAINGTVLAVVGVESAKAFRCSSERIELPNGATADTMDIDGDEDEVASSFSSLGKSIISVTPEGIPIIDTANGTTIDPRYSHSLGLALVRGIDIENGVLQLLTPLSAETIEDVASKGGEIVLVSGKFDAPSWAYTEDLYYRAHGEADDGTDLDESMDVTNDDVDDDPEVGNEVFTEATGATPVPWVEVLRGNQKRGFGSKVWRVRRDLGRTGN